MTFVPPLGGPPPAPKTLGVRGRITLRLIERPDATTDAAPGRN